MSSPKLVNAYNLSRYIGNIRADEVDSAEDMRDRIVAIINNWPSYYDLDKDVSNLNFEQLKNMDGSIVKVEATGCYLPTTAIAEVKSDGDVVILKGNFNGIIELDSQSDIEDYGVKRIKLMGY